MEFTEDDKALLKSLDLENIPDEEKQVVLQEIDNKMSERFVANLLSTLSPEEAKKVEAEVNALPSDDPAKIIETIIANHPDTKSVLEKTGGEVLEELKASRKKDGNTGSNGSINDLDSKPPIEEAAAKEPDMPSNDELKTEEKPDEVQLTSEELGEAKVGDNKPEHFLGPDEEPAAPAQAEPTPPTPQDEGPLKVDFSGNAASTEPEAPTTEMTPTQPEPETPAVEPVPAPTPPIPEPTETPVISPAPSADDAPIGEPIQSTPSSAADAEVPQPTPEEAPTPEVSVNPSPEATAPATPNMNVEPQPAPASSNDSSNWSFSSTPQVEAPTEVPSVPASPTPTDFSQTLQASPGSPSATPIGTAPASTDSPTSPPESSSNPAPASPPPAPQAPQGQSVSDLY